MSGTATPPRHLPPPCLPFLSLSSPLPPLHPPFFLFPSIWFFSTPPPATPSIPPSSPVLSPLWSREKSCLAENMRCKKRSLPLWIFVLYEKNCFVYPSFSSLPFILASSDEYWFSNCRQLDDLPSTELLIKCLYDIWLRLLGTVCLHLHSLPSSLCLSVI